MIPEYEAMDTARDEPLSREVPLDARQTALLLVDVQNYFVRRNGGYYADLPEGEFATRYGHFFDHFERVALPNMRRLQRGFRTAGIEVIYTTVECLTEDGRDRSLDYKISGYFVPKGSWDGRVVDELAPADNEVWLPKSSSNVFVSTHVDYVLRNLGIRQLVIAGVATDQCVESAVRDGCDLGYLVTLVTDACSTYSEERQQNSFVAIKGYCRQRTTEEVLAEVERVAAA
jgi:ureidoacrylate peracid hydrolase